MNSPSNKKPVDYLKPNRGIFKPINPGIEYFDHVKIGLPRSGWHPKTPQHYIYQQRVHSAIQRRKTELPALPSPRPVTALPSIHSSATSLQDDRTSVNGSERPPSSNLFCSTTKVKHVQLPQTGKKHVPRSAGYRTISVCSERYLATTPSPSMTGKKADTEQARRFEEEWANKEKCRLMRRLSEKPDYRVDRLYYISGVPCPRYRKASDDERDQGRRLKQITNGSALRLPTTLYRQEHDVTPPPQPPCTRNEDVDSTGAGTGTGEHVFLTEQTTEVTSSERLHLGQQIDVSEVQSEVLDDGYSDYDSIDDVPSIAVTTKADGMNPSSHNNVPNGNPERAADQSASPDDNDVIPSWAKVDDSLEMVNSKTDGIESPNGSESKPETDDDRNNESGDESNRIIDNLANIALEDKDETMESVEREFELALQEAFDDENDDEEKDNDEA